jgi:hypothetical protein
MNDKTAAVQIIPAQPGWSATWYDKDRGVFDYEEPIIAWRIGIEGESTTVQAICATGEISSGIWYIRRPDGWLSRPRVMQDFVGEDVVLEMLRAEAGAAPATG